MLRDIVEHRLGMTPRRPAETGNCFTQAAPAVRASLFDVGESSRICRAILERLIVRFDESVVIGYVRPPLVVRVETVCEPARKTGPCRPMSLDDRLPGISGIDRARAA